MVRACCSYRIDAAVGGTDPRPGELRTAQAIACLTDPPMRPDAIMG